MKKAKFVLQTILILILPQAVWGFNISLSFPDSSRHSPAEARGKVIKDRPIAKQHFRIKTVVIDPGHGGHDPGCLGHQSQEKHIALAVGQKLARLLSARHPDVKVVMTRDEDVFIPLHERAAIANRNQADLFISIHCNYIPKRSDVHGSETYVMGLHTARHNLEVAKRENDAILLEADYEKNYDYDPNSPEGHIILSMFQNAFLEQSILFAEKVEEKIRTDAKRRSRGVKQAGFVVLKETTMPSVLVEAGFLSNRSEEAFLFTDAGQTAIAGALANAFSEYRREMEGIEPETPPVAAIEKEQVKEVSYTEAEAPPKVAAPAARVTAPGRETDGMTIKTPANGSSVLIPQPSAGPAPPDDARSKSGTQPANAGERRIIPLRYGDEITPPDRYGAARSPDRESPLPATRENDVAAIRFAVQLAASPREFDTAHGRWQNLGYLVEVVQEEDMFKYQARNFASLEEASIARSELRERGFPDAFIVAYKNGRRINMDQARRELGLY